MLTAIHLPVGMLFELLLIGGGWRVEGAGWRVGVEGAG